MYLKKIVYRNVGPLKNVNIEPGFNEKDMPKPLVLVGENGSGKTTFLSNIIDSFYEFAGSVFSNVRKNDEETNFTTQYYKSISSYQITVGEKYLYSYILYDDNKNNMEYLFKSGDLDVKHFKAECDVLNKDKIGWNTIGNYKSALINSQEEIEKIFQKDVICSFSPIRYDKPVWMGNKYYELSQSAHVFISDFWKGKLKNPVSAEATVDSIIQWLLDVIVDSRPDVIANGNQINLDGVNIMDLPLLSQARDNIERIMSSIIGEEIKFRLNYRNRGADRFRVVRKNTNEVIAPTLNSLSTGQLALFNLFATVVKYADYNDINKSVKLEDITGIVVIDEVELHLHSILQTDVLPRLIKLFPRVQFIITTHAPLFVLGMEDEYGDDGFDIYELPDANKITAERFSEFNRAYSYYKNTIKYENELREAINETEKTLVITEGTSDWKHLKAAYNRLKNNEYYKEIFENLDFDFLEYEPTKSKSDAEHKYDMGANALCNMCETCAKLPRNNKLIFIADRDVEKVNKKLLGENEEYKKWGNGVYSFLIPIPNFRNETPNVSIEHLYTDDEIKTEHSENGIKRRLFMGNEFDDIGRNSELGKLCLKRDLCGPESISIIDGSSGSKVTGMVNDQEINYALSKNKFAECVLNGSGDFSKFDFKEFIPIFKTIKEICNE